MKTKTIWHYLLVITLSLALTVTLMPLGWQNAYAAGEKSSETAEPELSTAEAVLGMEQNLPDELDPESKKYNEVLAEGDLYGADTTQNLQGEQNEGANNNTPFMLSTQNELLLFAADNTSTTMYQLDNLDLEQTRYADGLRWVNGVNVANAEGHNALTSDDAVGIFKTLFFPQSIGLDRDGTGRDAYVATVGLCGGYITLVVQDASSGSYQSYPIQQASWMGTGGWLNDNYLAITAGDYDGDGKDSIIVYVCGDGDNVKLMEFTYGSGKWTGSDILSLSSVLKNTTFTDTTKTDMKYKPVVSLTTGDFDGDGGESFAYSAGYYNTSDNVNRGYVDFSADNLEQFATCVGVYDKDGGSWSASAPIWMYERGDSYKTYVDNKYTYEVSFIHAGVVAAGDVNNDGIDEIVVAGYTDQSYENTTANYSRAVYDKNMHLLTVSDVYNYVSSFAVSVISKKGNSYTKSDMQTFAMSKAQKYTFTKYCNDKDYEFVKVSAVCGHTKGNNHPEEVFISGIVYGGGENSVTLSEVYQPNIVCNNDLSATTGNIKHESSLNWVRNVAAGNFNGNNAGREQFVFTLWQKTNNREYYTSNIGVVTAVDFNDTVVKDEDGNIIDITAYGDPAGYACNLNAYDITNSCIKIDHATDKGASQFNVESDADKGKGLFLVPVAVDIDTDGVQGRFRSSGYVYSDPEVLAVLEGGPTFSEISELGGYEDGCSTTYEVSSGHESGTSNSDSVSFEVGFALEAEAPGVKESLEIGLCAGYTYSFEKAYSVETTYSFAGGSQDVVVVTRVPYLIYTYDLWDSANQEWIINGYNVRVPLAQSYSMLSVDEYNELVTEYNKVVGADSAYALKSIVYGKDLPADHYGKPDHYWSKWDDAGTDANAQQLHGNMMSVGYNDGSQSVSVSSAYAETITHEMQFGVHFGYTYQTGADLVEVEAWAGVYVNVDYSHSVGFFTTTSNGTAFSASVPNINVEAISIPGLTNGEKTKLIKKFGYQWAFGTWSKQLSKSGPKIPFYGYIVKGCNRPTLPPEIEDQSMIVTEGYKAFSIRDYTARLSADLTLIKTEGDDKITYDAASNSIKVAAGLEPGTYPVHFTVTNYIPPDDTDFTFTLTVTKDYTKNWTGRGTEEDPYVISDSEGWTDLAGYVASGIPTEGVYFLLGENIRVTESVGTGAHPFAGSFDGDGCTLTFNQTATGQNAAPFAVTNSAAIKNLHTEGRIETGYKFAGGLVGTANGITTVTNCRSSMEIVSSVEGDGTHGGFVGRGNVIFEGCLFDGRILGAKTTSCAGFLGYSTGSDSKCVNCLFDAEEVTTRSTTGTFIRNSENTSNCYYFNPLQLGKDTGKQAHNIYAYNDDGEEITIRYGNGTDYDVSGITAYNAGISYHGTFYAGSGDIVSLILPDPSVHVKEYQTDGAGLAGSGTDYILDMPDGDVHIVLADADDPSINSMTEELENLDAFTNEFPELEAKLDGLLEAQAAGDEFSREELDDVNIRLAEIEAHLSEVRSDFDALTDGQKCRLSEDDLTALAAAEKQLGELMTSADHVGKSDGEFDEMQYHNREAADQVQFLIDILQDPEELDPSDEEAIEEAMGQIREAEEAYANLTPQQKALVNNTSTLIAKGLAVRQKWDGYTPVEVFTVTFVDGLGDTLKIESVEKGGVATAPEDPTREGYTFNGWNKDFSNITSDLTVTAKWKKIPVRPVETFTVTFVDGQGNTLKTDTVESGNAATAPEDPTREGYTFDGWDQDFSNITSDLTVTAKWTENTAPQEKVSIKDAKVVLSKTKFTYNGKVQKPSIKSIGGLTLKAGTDYTAKWSNGSSKNAGTYTVTITGTGDYTGTAKASYTIDKAANPMTVKGKPIKVKFTTLKKKPLSYSVSKFMTVSKAQGTKTYKLKSVSKSKFKKYFSIKAKNGKLTIKKKLPKGTYTIKVKVTAAGTANYKPLTKTVSFKVIVK